MSAAAAAQPRVILAVIIVLILALGVSLLTRIENKRRNPWALQVQIYPRNVLVWETVGRFPTEGLCLDAMDIQERETRKRHRCCYDGPEVDPIGHCGE